MCNPTGHAPKGKQNGIHGRGNAHGFEGNPGVKIDIRIELFRKKLEEREDLIENAIDQLTKFEDDIKDNISLIQKVSESKNGEVSRWKL